LAKLEAKINSLMSKRGRDKKAEEAPAEGDEKKAEDAPEEDKKEAASKKAEESSAEDIDKQAEDEKEVEAEDKAEEVKAEDEKEVEAEDKAEEVKAEDTTDVSFGLADEEEPIDPEQVAQLASIFDKGAADEELPKQEASKKAGIKKLGGQPKVAAASGGGMTDISSIWETAPDVSEVFK